MNKSVYIVEDEHIIALNIKKQLNDLSYEVAGHSSTGEQAIEDVKVLKPDIVLMDIELAGELNGIQTASVIQSVSQIPVVFLTAYADNVTLKHATQVQPFGYIVKPFNQKELHSSIVMALYQKDMKAKLYERESQLQGILGAVTDPLILTDSASKIIYSNKAARDSFSLNSCTHFFNQEHVEAIHNTDLFRPLSGAGRKFEYKRTYISMDQEEQQVHIFRDVTELIDTNKRIIANEKRLSSVQKMEALGRLAGGVAHDFNNYLAVILGYVKLLVEDLRDDPKVLKDLLEIEGTTKKAASLTKQLLTLARNHKGVVGEFDIVSLIHSNLILLTKVLPKTIELDFKHPGKAMKAYVDSDLFIAAILNLIINARDAIGKQGSISVEIKEVELDQEVPCVSGTIAIGNYVKLSVRDDGCGIPSNLQTSIFEPFFSTKRAGLGTGLGLSNIYSLVSQWNGYIDLSSQPNYGSTFSLYLSKSMPVGKTENTVFSSNNTLNPWALLVSNSTNDPTAEQLTTLGFEVHSCVNAGEAYLLFEENPNKYALLVTELIMPKISGFRLAEKLNAISPHLPVLFVTSYSKEDISETLTLPEDINILVKPLSIDDLKKSLDKMEVFVQE